MDRLLKAFYRFGYCAAFVLAISAVCFAQTSAVKRELGSQTAKNGFTNESEIQAKFNNWRSDPETGSWLGAMGYKLTDIRSVTATKPHGEKADVELIIKTTDSEKREGISIKLVSSPNGFNQIDKRWLSHYAQMWKMPATVANALKLFVGETAPLQAGRSPGRMFLTELDPASQKAVIDFFTTNKKEIVSDLFGGDGPHAAGWIMVAFKATANTRWTLRRIEDAISFYTDGPVTITKSGNLRIGRVTMQRKGGDAGRETAKMLQFKINPVELFDLK